MDLNSEIKDAKFDFEYSDDEIKILKKYLNGLNVLKHLPTNLNHIEYQLIYMN